MFKFNKRKLTFWASIVVLLLGISSAIPVFKPFTLNLVKFPLALFTLAGREINGIIFYHRNLIQNERLGKDNAALKEKLNTLEELSLENARLKNLLYFKQKALFRTIGARVIGRSPDNWSSVVIIDKGSYHGIRRKMAVITELGLAGRVIETSEQTSKIMLINDPSSAVSALVQRSRQEGLVCGTLGNSLVMRYLSSDADIKVSDKIITSGLTEWYPKGTVIGTVIALTEEFAGLSRNAIIKPAVNLSSLEEVLIVIPL